MKKIVYTDSGMTKVVKGDITAEDDFLITVLPFDKREIRIGKNHIVQITSL